eukprot:jgi/Astpho2/4555/fgenesh1_pg.00067_%23_104_t
MQVLQAAALASASMMLLGHQTNLLVTSVTVQPRPGWPHGAGGAQGTGAAKLAGAGLGLSAASVAGASQAHSLMMTPEQLKALNQQLLQAAAISFNGTYYDTQGATPGLQRAEDSVSACAIQVAAQQQKKRALLLEQQQLEARIRHDQALLERLHSQVAHNPAAGQIPGSGAASAAGGQEQAFKSTGSAGTDAEGAHMMAGPQGGELDGGAAPAGNGSPLHTNHVGQEMLNDEPAVKYQRMAHRNARKPIYRREAGSDEEGPSPQPQTKAAAGAVPVAGRGGAGLLGRKPGRKLTKTTKAAVRSSKQQDKGPCLNPACRTNDTPQWRLGPMICRELCNKCGTRWQRAKNHKNPFSFFIWMRDDLLTKELPVPADIQELASNPAKAQAAMLEVQEAGQGHKRKRSHEQRVQAAAEVADELAEQSEEAASEDHHSEPMEADGEPEYQPTPKGRRTTMGRRPAAAALPHPYELEEAQPMVEDMNADGAVTCAGGSPNKALEPKEEEAGGAEPASPIKLDPQQPLGQLPKPAAVSSEESYDWLLCEETLSDSEVDEPAPTKLKTMGKAKASAMTGSIEAPGAEILAVTAEAGKASASGVQTSQLALMR